MPFGRRQPAEPATDPWAGDRLDAVLSQIARDRAGDATDVSDDTQQAWSRRAAVVRGGRWTPDGVSDPDETDVSDESDWSGDDGPVVGGRHRGRRREPGREVDRAGRKAVAGNGVASRLRPTVPRSLRGARLAVSPAAALGLVLLVLVVAGVLAIRVWVTQDRATPVPVAPVSAAGEPAAPISPGASLDATSATGSSSGSPATGSAGPDPAGTVGEPSAATVLVHVDGAVRHPGVVRLDAGARVQDAVRAAGGLTRRADTSRVNLARVVVDGERVWVPVPGEEPPAVVDSGGGAPGGAGGGGLPGAGAEGVAPSPVVDLNTADQAALEELPGVGPVTAGRILAWRTEHGQFSTVDELLEVSGIGERTLEQLRPHVTT